MLTLSGTATVAQYQAALESVTFSSSSHNPTSFGADTSRSISWAVNDGTLSSNLATTTITITAVNDAPVASIGHGPYSATEQASLTLKGTGLSISDVDAGSGSVTATLSVGEGTLTVTAGTSGAQVSGSGSLSVTISGTVAQINALLNTDGSSTVSYIDNSDTPSPSTTLNLSVNDNGNTGTGGPLISNTATATINITAVNDAPTLTATAFDPIPTFTEAVGLGTQAAPVLVFSNANANPIETGQTFRGLGFTVSGLVDGANETIVVDGTRITLGSNSSGVTTTNALNYTVGIVGGTASIVLASAGGISAISLDNLINSIAYQNTNTDNPTAGGRIFMLTSVQDSGGTANGGVDTTALSIASTVTVVAVDDPPVNAVPPGTLTVDENTALTFAGGNTISVHDADNNLATTQLTVLNGTVTVSLAGGASISAGANGSNTLTLSGSETQINAALATLSYQGGLNFIGSDTLTVRSTDSGALIDSDTISILVQNPNQDDWTNSSGGAWTTAGNWDHGVPTATTTALLNAAGTYTVTSSQNVTIDTLSSIATATLSITGGTFTVTNFTGQGPLGLSGGTFNIGNSTPNIATLTQSGGELTGSATVTVTGPGAASTISGGTQSGSGITFAQHGATLSGSSGLDGGRTLQLGGTSTTSGASVSLSLNSTNPNTGASDAGSGTLAVLNGATFTDATTGGLTISTANRGAGDDGTAAAVNNAGTFIKSGSGTSNISAAFNNTGIVDVQAGTLNLSGGNSTNVPTTDVGATYTTSTGSGTLQFSGGTRTLNNTSQITTTNVTFSGSQTTTVNGTYNVSGTTTVSGGTATVAGPLTNLGNALVISGGTLGIGNSAASVATLTQSGGELTGSATVTVTGPGAASTISGGTQSGSGITFAQHGATFSGSSGLDGGRTLQLGGTSTTSGVECFDQPEQHQSEYGGERCGLRHAGGPERSNIHRCDDGRSDDFYCQSRRWR